MDFDKLLARVKGILLQPAQEWPRIAEEAETTAGLYKRYILILAALPPLFQFIKYSLIGHHVLGMYLHDSFFGGLWRMLLGYLIALVTVYVSAQIVNALAPTFGADKNPLQALKTVAYAWTAAWVAGIAVILPWLGTLILIAGVIYSIYLLYLGLPHTMRCPPAKSAGYTALSTLLTLLLSWLLAVILGLMAGIGSMGYQHMRHDHADKARADVAAAMAKLHQIGDNMQDKDKPASSEANDDKAALHSLAPERMRAMLPARIGDYTRASARASRQSVTGMQFSQGKATYRDKHGHVIDLTIIDAAGAKALLAMSGSLAGDAESVTDNGFDKIRHDGDRTVHETWNSKDKHGRYTVLIANRFSVRASGDVDDFGDLKQAVESVDLDALEKLRDTDGAHP